MVSKAFWHSWPHSIAAFLRSKRKSGWHLSAVEKAFQVNKVIFPFFGLGDHVVDIHLDFLVYHEVDHPSSLRGVESCPNLHGAGLFFGAHVDLFRCLNRGDLMIFEATQTLFYLRHLTVLEEPFPKVYGLGLTELLSG
ncbi:hypothetical protein CRG98_026939 [Punica granatum]|uniref:Uncharacterized protein n=1 Tax=Punica granatum TaxID=22663 RepID=A0A2I0J8W0_PUNGR|nr:hypothetical protein CRG98_026939 [Punica granatum]